MLTHHDTNPGVRKIDVPDAARRLSTLAHIDYADAFLVDVDEVDRRTAEEWARAILDQAPRAVRLQLWSSWLGLGLRLGPPFSSDRIVGWEILQSTPDYVLLRAGSRIGMPGQLLIKREQNELLLDTFVQMDNPAARAVWASVQSTHERVVPTLLAQFRRRLDAQRAATPAGEPAAAGSRSAPDS